MMDIVIASREHAALVAQISRQSFDEAFSPTNDQDDMADYMDTAFTEGQIAEELEDVQNTFLLCSTKEGACGISKLRRGVPAPEKIGNATSIELQRLYVIEKAHGKGVGRALLEKSMEIARKEGVAYIWLGVWEHNPKAIRFYQNMGFEFCGSHDFVLGRDVQTDLEMYRRL
ncbi:MAG: GNAT family N-acetyltransferase [Bacteroidia bacterium]